MNKYTNTEKKIKKITLLSSTIIILLVATIIGIILIQTEFTNFNNHINNFKNTIIERKKFTLKTSVENLINDIKIEEFSILKNKKYRIKNQSIIAYNLAKAIYKKSKNLTKEEKLKFIKDALTQISNKENDINYFILDKKGTIILNTEYKKIEGENYLNIQDISGKKFINEIIHSNNKKQTFHEYFWYKPKSNILSKKILFARALDELDIIIGSTTFLEKIKENITSKIKEKIFKQSSNKEDFILIYNVTSLNDILNSDLIIQKHVIANKFDKEAIKDLLIKTNYKGNDFIFYEDSEKLMYGSFIQEYRYFIANVTNLNTINNIIKNERNISYKNLIKNITKLSISISVITIFFFIISLLFTKKIDSLFKNYKKRVISNEQKFKLLFNHSNNAFIISNKHKGEILSFNNTALKLTSYKHSELLNRNFFELFINLDKEMVLNKSSFEKTIKLKDKNNNIKIIELQIVNYNNYDENLLFSSLKDITERTYLKKQKRRQEQLLIQKSKMAAMGEMIENIAHQWRQPLSQISGLFFDIQSAYEYNELTKKYLINRINEANDLTEYMSKTIDDFRNFFDPNSKKEEFYIFEAVENALKILNSTLSFYKIKVKIKKGKDFKIYGFKNEYAQAIVNIISNAKDILVDRKVTNPKIKIYIKEEKHNTLYIEDNAGGVDKNILDKIFDPYFTTKGNYGTGIGLYMTKLIIEEKMNGEIKVENSIKGAIFSITV
ncbi:cache domain-containing protein [Malaciobacter mytili]|uniref:cache domain-containing protein n=1 Tax=Malaciobacter mytili TaxID=603050 RepID=UPI003A8B381B